MMKITVKIQFKLKYYVFFTERLFRAFKILLSIPKGGNKMECFPNKSQPCEHVMLANPRALFPVTIPECFLGQLSLGIA